MIKLLFDRSTQFRLVPFAVSRIMIGAFFLITGINKLINPVFQASMLKTITGIGFPYPQFTANFTAFNEALFGLLLTVGLFTRFSAMVLTIVLVVALITFDIPKLPQGLDPFTWYSYFSYLPQVLYLLFMLNVTAIGGGPLSIDEKIGKRNPATP